MGLITYIKWSPLILLLERISRSIDGPRLSASIIPRVGKTKVPSSSKESVYIFLD